MARRVMIVVQSKKSEGAAWWTRLNHAWSTADSVLLVRTILRPPGWMERVVSLFLQSSESTYHTVNGDSDAVLAPLLACYKGPDVEMTAVCIQCKHRRPAILKLIQELQITHLILETDDSARSRWFWSESFSQTILREAKCEVVLVNEEGKSLHGTEQGLESQTYIRGEASFSGEEDDDSSSHFTAREYYAGDSKRGGTLAASRLGLRAALVRGTPLNWEIGPIESRAVSWTGTKPVTIPQRTDSAATDSSSFVSTPESLRLMAEEHVDVFASHAGPSQPLVQDVAVHLGDFGYHVFVDKDWLQASDDAPVKIFDAARRAPIGLVFIDEYFLERKHPMEELQWITDAGKLLPVIIDMSFDVFKRKWQGSPIARQLDPSYYKRVCETSALLIDSVTPRNEFCQMISFAVTRMYVERVCSRLPDSLSISYRYIATAERAVEKLNKGIKNRRYSKLSDKQVLTAQGWPQLLKSYSSPRS